MSDPVNEAPIVRIAKSILDEAQKEGASEVSITWMMFVDYKVGKQPKKGPQMPGGIYSPLRSRYKIFANMLQRRDPMDDEEGEFDYPGIGRVKVVFAQNGITLTLPEKSS